MNETRGGLIIGCIFWFTGRWAYNWGGGGAYKWQFTVLFILSTAVASGELTQLLFVCFFRRASDQRIKTDDSLFITAWPMTC